MPIPRYHGAAQALHWLTAAALCLLLPCVWVAENFVAGPVRTFWYMAHESMGISVLLLTLMRLTWRWRHPPPPYSIPVPRLQAAIATVNHALLYAVLVLMPVTGYLIAGNGQPVPWFRLLALPGFPHHEALGQLADTLHVAGQFLLYLLLAMHVGATVWHVAVRRDGVLERMLPEQTGCKPPE
jgi:cytochrome b561